MGLAKLGGATVADPIFLLSWASLTGLWAFSSCLIEVTVTAHVRVVDQKLIARRNRFAGCVAIVLGLFAGLVITRFLEAKGMVNQTTGRVVIGYSVAVDCSGTMARQK